MGPVIADPIPEVFCTKWGTTRRGEMYILGGTWTASAMAKRRTTTVRHGARAWNWRAIFSMPDVTTDVTIRFALWNGEEGGLRGATRYVNQRKDLPGPAERAEVARHDPARHDDVGPRHAARRRHAESGAAAGSRLQHRVPDDSSMAERR
jgi:hypothetical protein